MKKVFIISLSILLFASINSYSQKFFGGIIVGISGSQVSGDNLAGFNKLNGYGGFYSGLRLKNNNNAILEISYLGKGSKSTSKNIINYKFRQHYAEVSLLYQFTLGKQVNLNGFVLEIGPSIGVLAAYKELINNVELFDPSLPDMHRFDFSVCGGLMYAFENNMSAHIRYYNSFLPFRPHKSGQTYKLNLGQYNTVITLALDYKF